MTVGSEECVSNFLFFTTFGTMKKIFTIVFLLCASPAFAQYSLDQFLSHPIESGFASSPDGKTIAWVVNDQGKRNILVKSGSDLPRFITDYPQDDGQEISQLCFLPMAPNSCMCGAVLLTGPVKIPIRKPGRWH